MQIQTDMSDWPIELVVPDVLSTEVQTEEQPLQSNGELQPVLQTCEVCPLDNDFIKTTFGYTSYNVQDEP